MTPASAAAVGLSVDPSSSPTRAPSSSVRTAVELLRFEPQSDRAAALFTALYRAAGAAGIEWCDRRSYQGTAPWLMLWGPGGTNRFAPMAQHVAKGGHVIAFDLAYWNRDTKVRVSIDGPHPQALVMAHARSDARFRSDPAPILNHWKPHGHVLVAGIGEKATAQYGDQVAHWEAAMTGEAKARGRAVLYRPKKTGTPIEAALRGAALVITWHSNVAVDAIRLGIPVICRDGAAAAVCGSTWPDEGMPAPLPDDRRRQFLHNLAWWQWDPAREAAACWRFLAEVLS